MSVRYSNACEIATATSAARVLGTMKTSAAPFEGAGQPAEDVRQALQEYGDPIPFRTDATFVFRIPELSFATSGPYDPIELVVGSVAASVRSDSEIYQWIEEWKRESTPLSFLEDAYNLPSYEKIVSLGMRAVPVLLQELAANADYWDVALRRITGEDPTTGDEADIEAVCAAWLRWGHSKGIL